MYLNIAGLTSHKSELEWIINQWKPVVVCLAETHVTEELNNNETRIMGYQECSALSTSRHTGGVSVYVKEEYRFKQIMSESQDMNYWIVGMQMFIKDWSILIFNVYHSPSASNMEFLERIDRLLDDFSTANGVLIIIGDFNINIARNTYYSEKLKNIINFSGLYQLVDSFTRVTPDTASIIDLIITNEKELPFQVHQTPKITDHTILTVDIPINNTTEVQKKHIRDYKNFNELQFQLALMDGTWAPNCTNTDVLAEMIVQNILTILNIHAPEVQKIIPCKWANKDWWTREIGQQINIRDELYKKAIITNDASHWESYKKQRNKIVNLVRKEKAKYYNEKIDECKGNSIDMWKTLKQLVGNNKKIKLKEGIIFNRKLERNETEIAEQFNCYFLESIEEIASTPNQAQIEEILRNMGNANCSMESFKILEMKDLKTIVNSMPNKKSSTDGITTKILKLALESIGDRFLHLINTSLQSGSFPSSWKTSTIIPLEKKCNTIKCEEFRPINMVPVYEKLLELSANRQIIDYVESNHLLTPYQSGFREKNSCESALQTVLATWKRAIGEKKCIGVVFLDFKRAFETIDRQLLILKLKNFGFGESIIKWFSEYLQDRSQITKYNNSVSTTKNTTFGVPQGTVMGPNLFIMYINDIVKHVKKCSIQLFADDTLIYFVGDCVADIITTINSELKTLTEWLNKNSLKVNVNKTKFIILKSKYNTIDTLTNDGIYIEDEKVEQVNECKYLGVIIDQYLSFSGHAVYISKKIAKKVNLLGRIGSNLSSWTKLLVYKTIVQPHLKFCSSILYLLNNTELNILQKIQNKALRIILGCSRYTSIRYMLESTNLLSVRQSIFVDVMTTIFKIRNGLYPQYLMEQIMLVENIHDYDTRSRGNFYVPSVATTFCQNSLLHKGLIEYNKLPNELKNSKTVDIFKNKWVAIQSQPAAIEGGRRPRAASPCAPPEFPQGGIIAAIE